MHIKVEPVGEHTSWAELLAKADAARDGELTTDHSASSRGLPVVVVDGQALGPAEVGALCVSTYLETDDVAGRDIHRQLTSEETDLIAAAERAGYRVIVHREER